MPLEADTIATLKKVWMSAPQMALASTEQKNAALKTLAAAIRSSAAKVVEANKRDLKRASDDGRGGAFVERLTLTPARIEAMAKSVEEVAALADPVGNVIEKWRRPNGLEIAKVRVPLGVIAIIYESRPNVTIDAGALGFKAGNAIVLRGGKEALESNARLADLIGSSLEQHGLNLDAVTLIRNPDREVIQILKRHPELIDLIIPRGGKALKEALEGSAVPLLPHFDGLCHTYVDRGADLKMAEEICFNAKCSRPSVCNAMENLLVHSAVADAILPPLAARMKSAGVELRGDERTRRIVRDARPASDEDWDTEYLDLILSVKIVDSIDEAIAFIGRHGSHLADAIVTDDAKAAARFEREVDSATVYVNASTRFTDGFEFGFGAETGISTNRLHARGPMGLNELTTYKYVIRGSGQVRL
ncbi:MAG: glutamate-5-semialdehyde dehydrogenase [Candidatus Binatus sp.]|uniref:glutamate-5-semialdehyde dehydrogenase n=1 Tax=Candidatus Binatus sp. TaxID=2811406 RepID=UPI00272357B3|nr:glutamate-5-semialdehyde dehydrogenase [Candidatus Binatus sp.]MDO8433023.1 glutamate-5-semialdehyde dehydrogenase [Candidatus Binatus sp.]